MSQFEIKHIATIFSQNFEIHKAPNVIFFNFAANEFCTKNNLKRDQMIYCLFITLGINNYVSVQIYD